jgi:hypothetical protein
MENISFINVTDIVNEIMKELNKDTNSNTAILPSVPYRYFNRDDCPVCLEDFDDLDHKKLMYTKCGHLICYNCYNRLNNGTETEFKCPICRASFGKRPCKRSWKRSLKRSCKRSSKRSWKKSFKRSH